MPHNDLLPEAYSSGWGRHYPLRVGMWVKPVCWSFTDPVEPFEESYLWRLQEPTPGQYVAVAYDSSHVTPVTPDNAWYLYPLEQSFSERLRIDQYPAYWQRFRAQGVAVFFYEGERGRVVLSMEKPRNKQRVVLMPLWVADLQRDAQLMGQWLEQMLWCMTHPRKADALFWAVQQGATPFGRWPELATPAALDKEGSGWLPLYRAERRRPVTQEEIEAAWTQAYRNMEAHLHESKVADEIRTGHYDELLGPAIGDLLEDTGVDPIE